jgi:acid stress-induced BolA-like protein IbaG/YrbA
MKGQLNSILEFNMELELIEVDGDGMRFGIVRQFSTTQNLIENTGDFIWTGGN